MLAQNMNKFEKMIIIAFWSTVKAFFLASTS